MVHTIVYIVHTILVHSVHSETRLNNVRRRKIRLVKVGEREQALRGTTVTLDDVTNSTFLLFFLIIMTDMIMPCPFHFTYQT
jgi:hypothetical protein